MEDVKNQNLTFSAFKIVHIYTCKYSISHQLLEWMFKTFLKCWYSVMWLSRISMCILM